MAVERSCCHLEIPTDVSTVLAGVNAQCYLPLWTFSKHNSGYSLKLFWRSKQLNHTPNNAHSTSLRKKCSRQRMEPFLEKKFREAAILKQADKGTTSGANVGSPTNTLNPSSDASHHEPGDRHDYDDGVQCPSDTVTCSIHAPQYNECDAAKMKGSPVASRTRSKASCSQCKQGSNLLQSGASESDSRNLLPPCRVSPASYEDSGISNMHSLMLNLPSGVSGVTKHLSGVRTQMLLMLLKKHCNNSGEVLLCQVGK